MLIALTVGALIGLSLGKARNRAMKDALASQREARKKR
jgi:hypothetical protein